LAAAVLWPTIILILGDLGLGFAFAYYIAKEPASAGKLITLALATGSLIGTGLATAAYAVLLHVPSLTIATKIALRMTMPSVPAMLISGYLAYLLLGGGHLAAHNLIRVAGALTYPIVTLTLVLSHRMSVSSAAAGFLAAQTLTLVLAASLGIFHYRPLWTLDASLIRRVFTYGALAYLSSVAAQTSLRLDQMLMTIFLSPGELGQYVVAAAVGNGMGPWFSALAVIVLQHTARSEGTSAIAAAERQVKLGASVAIPMVLLLCPALPWLLPFVFGTEFRAAVLPAQVLLVAAVFQGMNAVLGNGLRGLGRPKSPMFAQAAGLLVSAALLAALLRPFRGLGAAISAVCASGMVLALQWWMLNRAKRGPADATAEGKLLGQPLESV
jgi:O-antigen/teichoic acid export membrane protein